MDATAAIDLFFAGKKQEWTICDALRAALIARWPELSVRAMKTCISFDAPRPCCYVSPPKRKKDAGAIVVSFGLDRHLNDKRIDMAVEAAPGRFTHHLLLRDPGDIDEQMLKWLDEARALKWKVKKEK